MSLLVVGSIAIDSVETPFGKRAEVLGGSAVYFSISSSFFTDVNIVGVVGTDFPVKYIRLLQQKGINTDGLEIQQGKTFRWKGAYGHDLNNANTLFTGLNVFKNFLPKIPRELKKIPYLFLANIDPNLQLLVLKNVYSPRIVACDSMNFWIQNELKALKRLLKKVDIFIINDAEIRLLSGESNLIGAAKYIFSLGVKKVIIKRGDSGALFLTSGGGRFYAPAYLMEKIKDPTGAGDSFAGGFMGYLSRVNSSNPPEAVFRRAVVYGTMMASFCVQDFGPGKLLGIDRSDIEKRLSDYKRMVRF